jgi:hypothetical protein
MRLVTILSCAVLAAGAFLVLPERAEASPGFPGVAAHGGDFFGGRISIGGGIQFPIGRSSRVVDGGYVEEGHWETRYREVQVYRPGPLIGYDVHHRPIHAEGTYTIVQEPYQVWVVDRRYHRVVRVSRPVGWLSLGGRWRIR